MPANPIGLLLRHRRAGHDALVWAREDLQAPETFSLTSPAFADGDPMPQRYRGRLRGLNVSPPLTWSAPPVGTSELVLIVQDPDVPIGKPAVHALSIGIDPTLHRLDENALTHPSPVDGLRHGNGPFGRRGWMGPMPPRSHGPHAYVFQLFAVDHRLDLPERFTLEQTIEAIRGGLLARARLDGIYEKR